MKRFLAFLATGVLFAGLSSSARAQFSFQSILLGSTPTITLAGPGSGSAGTFTFPPFPATGPAPMILTSTTGQVIDGALTLGFNGSQNAVPGEIHILDGVNPGDSTEFLWSGGNFYIEFGNTSSSPGTLNIAGQPGTSSAGGAVSIIGGAGASASTNGGAVSLAGGGSGNGTGGAASVTGGSTGTGTGGAASLVGGNSTADAGGEAEVIGGAGGNNGSSGVGGETLLSGGSGGSAGLVGSNGGVLVIQGGNGGSGSTGPNGSGGSITIQGGSPGSGNGATGSTGSVSIQTTAGSTSIGNTSGTSIVGESWNVTDGPTSTITATHFNGDASTAQSVDHTLSDGTHITGGSFNGSAAITIGTDATNANTASTIVARDGSGNFSAGTITAALNGDATTAQSVDHTLSDGTHITGGSFNGSAAITIGTDATNANTASTIVARDGSGNFSAGTITAALNGDATTAQSVDHTLSDGTHITGGSFNGSANVTIGTDATNSNTVSTIVARDGSGNFSAGTITAALNGDATTAQSVDHTLSDGTHITGGSFNGSAAITIGTDATNLNTASTIVARDGSGNFSAGTITAALSGNATTANSVNNSLSDGTHITGGSFNGSANVTIATDATNANTVSTIVARDGSGNFSAGTITAALTGTASNASALENDTWAAPGAIGSGTASTGAFTQLAAGQAISGSDVFDVTGVTNINTSGSAVTTIGNIGTGGNVIIDAETCAPTPGTITLNAGTISIQDGCIAAGTGVSINNNGHGPTTLGNTVAATTINGQSWSVTDGSSSSTISATHFDGTLSGNATTANSVNNSLSDGTHITGGSFNGSAAITIGTDATNANTVSTIVARDASGNFSAGTITAALNGDATTAQSVDHTLSDGTHITGGSFNGSAAITIGTDATNANTASTIVARDGSGNFSAGTITAALTGTASNASELEGDTWAAPGTIGSTTPNTGAFTTLSASASPASAIAVFNVTNNSALAQNWGEQVTVGGGGNVNRGITFNVTGAAGNNNFDLIGTGANWSISAAGVVAGTDFSGPGTDLTGTATSLNIGGNAATATSATTASNASELEGDTWAAPGTIGSTTPNTGAFTTLSASASPASAIAVFNVTNNSALAQNWGEQVTVGGGGNVNRGITFNVTGAAGNNNFDLVGTGANWSISAAGVVAGTDFSGPGTDLTGTATSLNIGGNAATATSATTASNASELEGDTWAAPGTIGSTTPNTGAFTTLSASASPASAIAVFNVTNNSALAQNWGEQVTVGGGGNVNRGITFNVTGAAGNNNFDLIGTGANWSISAAGVVAGSDFSGPGTDLTGTATSLNIGGNAATATSATTASNASALENDTWASPGTIGSTALNTGAFSTLGVGGVVGTPDLSIDASGNLSTSGTITTGAASFSSTSSTPAVTLANTGGEDISGDSWDVTNTGAGQFGGGLSLSNSVGTPAANTIEFVSGLIVGSLTSASLTGTHTWTLPDADGTIITSAVQMLYGSASTNGSDATGTDNLFNVSYNGATSATAAGATINSTTTGTTSATGLTVTAQAGGGTVNGISVSASGGATNNAINVNSGALTIDNSGNLSTSGTITAGGHIIATSNASVASATTVTIPDNPVVILTGSNSITTMHFPASPLSGDVINVINESSANVTIEAQTSPDPAQVTIPAGGSRLFYFDGSNWQ